MSQHSTSSAVERKSELLIIARRSRIRWVRSAGDVRSNEPTRKLKPARPMGNERTLAKISSSSKSSPFDAFQRAFDFLTDIIADGETIDIESLTRKIDISEYDDISCDEATDETNTECAALSILGEIAIENYSYEAFLDILCSRNAVGVVKSMQQFVSKFESKQRTRTTGQRTSSRCYIDEKTSYEESAKDAEIIWTFLDYIVEEIQPSLVPLSTIFTEQLNLTKKYCEKFLFFHLYPSTFHNSFEDYFLNEKLFERIQSLSFLRPEHLDIKGLCTDINMGTDHDTNIGCTTEKWWTGRTSEASAALNELQYASCPDDKMTCIKRAVLSIANISLNKNKTNIITDIDSVSTSSSSISHLNFHGSTDININPYSTAPPSADDILPILILCIKDNNPINLHSELKYLQIYLNPSLSLGEVGYLITQFASAVNFLETVDSTALSISLTEFNKSIKKCREKQINIKLNSFGVNVHNGNNDINDIIKNGKKITSENGTEIKKETEKQKEKLIENTKIVSNNGTNVFLEENVYIRSPIGEKIKLFSSGTEKNILHDTNIKNRNNMSITSDDDNVRKFTFQNRVHGPLYNNRENDRVGSVSGLGKTEMKVKEKEKEKSLFESYMRRRPQK